jgi:uncharacterized protein
MLAFNVATLLKSAPGTTRDVDVEDRIAPLLPGVQSTGPVQGTARLFRTQDGIVVWADLRVSVEIECSRCLEPVPVEVTTHFEEEYRPVINITTGAPLDPPEDEALRIDERHTLDLTETARQYLLTALPLSAVCSAACKGLCPTCGADLNEGPCACGADVPSNPFAALAGMFSSEPQSHDAESR